MIKFLLILKEFYYSQKKEELEKNDKKLSLNDLPNYCNIFYSDFLYNNNYFGMDNDDIKEIVDIILHFFTWLYKSDYTKEKLSLAK